jgi:hypothetical protein
MAQQHPLFIDKDGLSIGSFTLLVLNRKTDHIFPLVSEDRNRRGKYIR